MTTSRPSVHLLRWMIRAAREVGPATSDAPLVTTMSPRATCPAGQGGPSGMQKNRSRR